MVDFESVQEDTPIDTLAIPALTRATLARFAGAVDDYNPVYLDDKVAAATGKSSVFAPANLVMGYLGRVVQSYFAEASVRRYGMRLLKLVWPGDVLTCEGRIKEKRVEGGEHIIDADVEAKNQRGEKVAQGRVIAVVPATETKSLTKASMNIGIVLIPKGTKLPSGSSKKKAPVKKAAAASKTTAKKKVTKKKVTKKKTTKKKTTKKKR